MNLRKRISFDRLELTLMVAILAVVAALVCAIVIKLIDRQDRELFQKQCAAIGGVARRAELVCVPAERWP